jgi:hypothetical protein
MPGLKRQQEEVALDWQTRLYSYDHIPVPDEYKAAHQISLGFLPARARPHWLVASSSGGINAFGNPVAKACFHLGWVRIVAGDEYRSQKIPAEFRTLNALPPRHAEMVVQQYRREKAQLLEGSAHRPLMAHTMHLVNPALRFHDLIYGPDCEAAMQAFLRLNAYPDMLRTLHEAVLDSSTPLPVSLNGFTPLPASQDSVEFTHAGLRLDTLVVERPFCDTVFTLSLPAMTPAVFATVAQILRTRTAEFRSRLWQRGGIYGAGLEVSLSHRICSWWTNLDHAPLETCRILRDIIREAEQVTLNRHEPERALAFFPTPAPALAGNLRDCQDRLWGITSADRGALLESQPVKLPAGFWENLLDGAVFGVAGSRENIAHIHDQVDAIATRPNHREPTAYATLG